jgi:arylsulfatase A-like enzyme
MPDQPNVLFVLCDQLRAQALGYHGNEQVATPNLDRFADEGVAFERAYTPNPVCCPARGSILTGCYPHVHGVVGNNLRLPTDEPTMGTLFRDAGYATGYVGKWHLDGEPKPGHIPAGERRQGFEFWRGFNRGHDHLRGHPHPNPDGSVDWEEGYQPELQTDMAIEHIDESGEAPFFTFLSWGPPHGPFEAPEEYSAMYDPEELDLRSNVPDTEVTAEMRAELAEYYALITSLDDQFGRLLDALAERDLAEDTVVVFTADHGEMVGSQGRYRKNYPFEESVHVPLAVRYPEEFEGGHRSDAVVNLVDLLPTLCSLCDVETPARVQGRDRTGLLADDDDPSAATETYIQGQIPYDEAWRAIRTDRHLLVVDRALGVQYLFDTATDPDQMENLAGDPAHADTEERLRERLLALAREYDDRTVMAVDATARGTDDATPRKILHPRGATTKGDAAMFESPVVKERDDEA